MENQNLKEFCSSLKNFKGEINKSIDLLEKAINKVMQEENKPKKREFPKTFEEVLSILRTAAEDDVNNCLYLLWNRIYPLFVNQTIFADIKQEIATLRCMLIVKAINIVDVSDNSYIHYLSFYLGNGRVSSNGVDDGYSFVPDALIFKSKMGADHALKYFKAEWKEMFTDSK